MLAFGFMLYAVRYAVPGNWDVLQCNRTTFLQEQTTSGVLLDRTWFTRALDCYKTNKTVGLMGVCDQAMSAPKTTHHELSFETSAHAVGLNPSAAAAAAVLCVRPYCCSAETFVYLMQRFQAVVMAGTDCSPNHYSM